MREAWTRHQAKFVLAAVITVAGALWHDAGAKIVVFDYDQAGNRVKRELSAPPMQSRAAGDFSTDMLESEFITIGPNPTTGVVKIEVSNFVGGDNGRICVYTTAGQLIAATQMRSAITEINIGSKASGMYVFIVETEKASSRSMIIKK